MLGCTKTTNIYSWLIDQYFFVTSTYFQFGFSRVVFLAEKSNAHITMINATNQYWFIKTCLPLNKLLCQHFLSLWNSPTPFPNKAVSAQVCTYVLHRPVAMLYSSKEIQIILRLFLVIAMFNQFKPVFFNHSTSDVASWLGRKPRYMQQVAIHQKQPIYYLNFLSGPDSGKSESE